MMVWGASEELKYIFNTITFVLDKIMLPTADNQTICFQQVF